MNAVSRFFSHALPTKWAMAMAVSMPMVIPAAHAAESDYREIANLEHKFIEKLDQRDYAGLATMFAGGKLVIARPDLAQPPSASGKADVAQMLTKTLPTPHANGLRAPYRIQPDRRYR